jgi:hypothetical protein
MTRLVYLSEVFMTPLEFAKLVKSKYPSYANMEDNLLVKKVIDKHPEYRKQIDFTPHPLTLKNVGQEALTTLKNIPSDISQTGKDIYGLGKSIVSRPEINVGELPGIAKKIAVGAGEAVGQFGANLVYSPKETLKKVAINMQERPVTTATTALFGIPGASELVLGGTAKAIEGISTGLARRALGYTKPFLKTAQAREKANIVADTMLKEHIIPNLGNTKKAMENVEILLADTGQSLATIREGLQTTGLAFNPLELDDKIINALMPKLQGGAFQGTKNTVEKIRKTILAGGADNVDFKTATDILDKLNENAGYGVVATASQKASAKLFRKAAGIVSDEIDNAVEQVAKTTNQPKLLENYLNNKQLYSKAKDAQKVLNNKLAAEQGNNQVGLRTAALAAGELGAGNPLGAAMTIGGVEAIKRRGMGMAAVGTRNTANVIKKIGELGVPKNFLIYKGK